MNHERISAPHGGADRQNCTAAPPRLHHHNARIAGAIILEPRKPIRKNHPTNRPRTTSIIRSMAWGALLGSGLGLTIGAFTQHWLAWAVMIGASCLIIGALIDRSRL